ncbi:hypothetical protein HELRODRAFT_79810, partial [Helobdella robusta]|uniref:F-box/LRR-repeat protein 15-like leucin rich repeat domain-containing protein n=1 Tax=Helobdella robusta TaxID=6412 RepID=T1G3T7_HELRO
GLTCIAYKCKYIQFLDLCDCQNVCDYGVINIIRSCKFLKFLDLGGCMLVTDKTLQSIGSEGIQLHSVSLSKTNITDDGVYSMLKGPCSRTLTEIHLNNNNDLTDDSIVFIATSCPNLRVFSFHNCPNLTERSRQALQSMSPENLKNITFTVY